MRHFTALREEVGTRTGGRLISGQEQQVDQGACIPPSCHATAVFCQSPPTPPPAPTLPSPPTPLRGAKGEGRGLFSAGLQGGMRTTYCYWKFGLVCVSM